MSDDEPPREDHNVLVFRNNVGQPVAVPDEVVTAAERAYRCYNAKIGGKSWQQIAVDEGYPSASAAKYDVDRYMEEARALVVEKSQRDMLEMEVSRLDYLQTRIWPAVESGSLHAVREARGIIMDRAKVVTVLGMIKDEGSEESARTVVVRATSGKNTFIADLQKAAGDDTTPLPPPEEGD